MMDITRHYKPLVRKHQPPPYVGYHSSSTISTRLITTSYYIPKVLVE